MQNVPFCDSTPVSDLLVIILCICTEMQILTHCSFSSCAMTEISHKTPS